MCVEMYKDIPTSCVVNTFTLNKHMLQNDVIMIKLY